MGTLLNEVKVETHLTPVLREKARERQVTIFLGLLLGRKKRFGRGRLIHLK